MSRKPLDLTGYRSGDLEFIRPAGTTPRGAILWECICHRCGRTCQIIGNRVHDPRPPVDCGCRKREREADLSGTFGALEVLERRGTYKNGDKLYLCRCTLCGGEKLVPASTIRANPKSCGCAKYASERMAAQSKLGVAAKFRTVIKTGFLSVESARQARERMREELLEKYGIEDNKNDNG